MRPAFARPARPRSLAASLSRVSSPPPTERVHDRPPDASFVHSPAASPPPGPRVSSSSTPEAFETRDRNHISRTPAPFEDEDDDADRRTRRTRSIRAHRSRPRGSTRSTRSSSTDRSSSIDARRSSRVIHPSRPHRGRARSARRSIDPSCIIHRHCARRRPRRRRRETGCQTSPPPSSSSSTLVVVPTHPRVVVVVRDRAHHRSGRAHLSESVHRKRRDLMRPRARDRGGFDSKWRCMWSGCTLGRMGRSVCVVKTIEDIFL